VLHDSAQPRNPLHGITLEQLLTIWSPVRYLLLLVLLPSSAHAFDGRVLSVHDGDTLTVLVDRRQVSVRLAEIDAPEIGQPFGKRSRESLAALCAAQQVEVQDLGLDDRKERTIGRVTCRQTDASAHQVRKGMAWVYERDSTPSSPLYASQALARHSGRGLWASPDQIPPWEWRAQRRSAGGPKSM
jgi:endonuclease YncB( thermonuclease family)